MRPTHLFLSVALALVMGCSKPPQEADGPSPETGGLSATELEHGIGPAVDPGPLGELDATLTARGQEVFDSKCLACHKLGERFIGPDLTGILSRRSPRYVLNMILNPEEMVRRHPEAKKLLAEYLAPMAQQNLSQDEARAVLEYIRSNPAQDASRAAQ
ncbi:MAG: cytochrome c [bacterium]|jgi:mono/diheme cytochrome c family protein|nr:cytochrome c [bacterium]